MGQSVFVILQLVRHRLACCCSNARTSSSDNHSAAQPSTSFQTTLDTLIPLHLTLSAYTHWNKLFSFWHNSKHVENSADWFRRPVRELDQVKHDSSRRFVGFTLRAPFISVRRRSPLTIVQPTATQTGVAHAKQSRHYMSNYPHNSPDQAALHSPA